MRQSHLATIRHQKWRILATPQPFRHYQPTFLKLKACTINRLAIFSFGIAIALERCLVYVNIAMPKEGTPAEPGTDNSVVAKQHLML
jgi:hypothetical protein